MLLSHIGAVYGETRHDFGKCIAQAFESEVAGVTFSQSDTAENVCQHIQLTSQCTVHHNFLGLIEQGVKVASLAEEGTINAVHFRNGVRIDKQPIHQIGKVITRGAVNWPVFR